MQTDMAAVALNNAQQGWMCELLMILGFGSSIGGDGQIVKYNPNQVFDASGKMKADLSNEEIVRRIENTAKATKDICRSFSEGVKEVAEVLRGPLKQIYADMVVLVNEGQKRSPPNFNADGKIRYVRDCYTVIYPFLFDKKTGAGAPGHQFDDVSDVDGGRHSVAFLFNVFLNGLARLVMNLKSFEEGSVYSKKNPVQAISDYITYLLPKVDTFVKETGGTKAAATLQRLEGFGSGPGPVEGTCACTTDSMRYQVKGLIQVKVSEILELEAGTDAIFELNEAFYKGYVEQKHDDSTSRYRALLRLLGKGSGSLEKLLANYSTMQLTNTNLKGLARLIKKGALPPADEIRNRANLERLIARKAPEILYGLTIALNLCGGVLVILAGNLSDVNVVASLERGAAGCLLIAAMLTAYKLSVEKQFTTTPLTDQLLSVLSGFISVVALANTTRPRKAETPFPGALYTAWGVLILLVGLVQFVFRVTGTERRRKNLGVQ